MFIPLITYCTLFHELTLAPSVQSELLREEPLELQQTILDPENPAAYQRSRIVLIAPERDVRLKYSKPDKLEDGPVLTRAQSRSPDYMKRRKPERTMNDDLQLPPLEAKVLMTRNIYNPHQYENVKQADYETGMENMGKQGLLDPLGLLTSLLGGSRRPSPPVEFVDGYERPREQGLLNGLLSLPEINLSIA